MRVVPDVLPAKKIVVATPFIVSAAGGMKLPRMVPNVTCVPLCTGVPAGLYDHRADCCLTV